jgi:hypothetical protein
MFGFRKKRETAQLPPRAAYDLGETIGRCLFRAVSGYVDYRLSQLTVKTLTLLRAERVRSLDPDIARVEREGIAAFDAVPLEGLQKNCAMGA